MNTIVDFCCRAPTPVVTRLATQVLLGGRYLTWPSPCGNNCTYAIQFQGPSYQCENALYVNLTQEVNPTVFTPFQSVSVPSEAILWLAAEDPVINYGDQYRFEMQWNQTQNMSCTLYYATYDLNVTYQNNVQNVITRVANGELVTYLNGSDTDTTIVVNRNLLALKDGLINLLKGFFGDGENIRNNTIVDQSTLMTVDSHGTVVQCDISPARMEELLQNVTISILSVSPSNVSTTILETNVANFYTFYRPINLLLPYSFSLAAALFFIFQGLLALKSNGVSASGGFLQILTTTRASETLNCVAEKSSLGGRENVTRELKEMQVLYGELPLKDGSTGVQRFGFGTPGEVIPLGRRKFM